MENLGLTTLRPTFVSAEIDGDFLVISAITNDTGKQHIVALRIAFPRLQHVTSLVAQLQEVAEHWVDPPTFVRGGGK